MAGVKRKYPMPVFAERGDAIFEAKIRPTLKPEDDGKFVAIDIETGRFALGSSELQVIKKLRALRPQAQIWLRRTDSATIRHFGSRVRIESA
jgi:hypothetical protein